MSNAEHLKLVEPPPAIEPPPEPVDPLVGTTIDGRYQIIKVLGQGGMGVVYTAKHAMLGKRLAIKVLKSDVSKDQEIIARFRQEAQSASAIGSQHIIDISDFGALPDGSTYFVMEYLDGVELTKAIEEQRPMPASRVVHIAKQLCDALGAAHERGIVHRDMKPENVFLIGDPTAPFVKLLDFGISKQQNGTAALTRTGMIIGTPAYMAPEQARGAHVDHRVDVYAVGAILYRALTGRCPFEAEDPPAVLTAVLTAEPVRPRTLVPAIPDSVELLIQRAMMKDRDERFSDIRELEEALAELDPDGPLPSSGHVAPLSRTNKSGGTAKTMPAISGTGEGVARSGAEARQARPRIVLLSAVSYFWIASGIAMAIADAVRAGGEGAPASLTETEALLIAAGTLLGTVTPAVLWGRHVRSTIWGNSMRSVRLARRLQRAVLWSIASFGFLALCQHLFEGLVERLPLHGGRPELTGAVFVVSLAFGAAAWMDRMKLR
ncbi:MAG TPA: serine/threonine-protein kinase [Polyangiaceae bacterium]|nr:serine/threonine-protein kinase [Polyangiaceae bacterium]